VKAPVAAGRIVSVFGEEIEKAAVDKVQKHSTFPAPAPVLFRMTAYLMLFSADPDAVNTSPAVVKLNFICFVDAPTVHLIAGMLRPLAAYPPLAEISPPTEAQVEIPVLVFLRTPADADARHSIILKIPSRLIAVADVQMFLFALVKIFHAPAAMSFPRFGRYPRPCVDYVRQ
jgi:hypothetical protein